VEVPGGAVFEVVENLRKDVDLILGRFEIGSWVLYPHRKDLNLGKY